MKNLVQVESIVKTFGGLKALNDCSLEIKENSITGIIGPNGSGKSTLFNVITGNLKPDSGKVTYNGNEITNQESHDLFHQGILRTFQIAHEFTNMTVIENLMVVPGNQKGESLLYALMNKKDIEKDEELIKEKAIEVLQFLKIEHLRNERAGNLSGGQKKLLELARTMMVDAKIVFLDEVGAGVNKTLLNDISDSCIFIPPPDVTAKSGCRFSIACWAAYKNASPSAAPMLAPIKSKSEAIAVILILLIEPEATTILQSKPVFFRALFSLSL